MSYFKGTTDAHKQTPSLSINTCVRSLCWPRLKRFTLLVNVEWPSLPSVLVAKATACHPPSGLISPWWMTTSRSCSAVSPLKKRTQTRRHAASARNHHSSSTIKMVPNDILLTDTALQLLEVFIRHGVIKLLGGWQAVAFAMGTLGRLAHSTSTHC